MNSVNLAGTVAHVLKADSNTSPLIFVVKTFGEYPQFVKVKKFASEKYPHPEMSIGDVVTVSKGSIQTSKVKGSNGEEVLRSDNNKVIYESEVISSEIAVVRMNGKNPENSTGEKPQSKSEKVEATPTPTPAPKPIGDFDGPDIPFL